MISDSEWTGNQAGTDSVLWRREGSNLWKDSRIDCEGGRLLGGLWDLGVGGGFLSFKERPIHGRSCIGDKAIKSMGWKPDMACWWQYWQLWVWPSHHISAESPGDEKTPLPFVRLQHLLAEWLHLFLLLWQKLLRGKRTTLAYSSRLQPILVVKQRKILGAGRYIISIVKYRKKWIYICASAFLLGPSTISQLVYNSEPPA